MLALCSQNVPFCYKSKVALNYSFAITYYEKRQ